MTPADNAPDALGQPDNPGRGPGWRVPKSLAVLFVVVSSLLATEGLVRLAARFSPALEEATERPGMRGVLRGLVRPDDEIGYGLVPGYDGRGEAPIHVQVNSLGMRDREYLHDTREGQRFVLAGGDSFSFGASVEVEEGFLFHLEGLLRHRDPSVSVVKAGVPGYSVVQTAANIRRHLRRFEPELVIVQLIPETEERNINPHRVVGGAIVSPRKGWHYYAAGAFVYESPFAPGPLASADVWASRVSHAYRAARRPLLVELAEDGRPTSWELEQARSLAVETLARLDHTVRVRGGRLLVVLNNWARASTEEWESVRPLNDRYVEALRSRNIEVFNTMPAFESETERVGYLGQSPNDGHWNTEGHSFAARIIAGHIAREGLLETPVAPR